MADYKFIQNQISGKWVIQAPRRAKRPNEIRGTEPICPFCPGQIDREEIDRIGGQVGDDNWKVIVIPNKFPFGPHQELIIHSPDHHKGFDELPVHQNKLVLEVYKQRYNEHREKGQVYIFFNHGPMAGESLPHPHTQLLVVPNEITLDIPRLKEASEPEGSLETNHFKIYSPDTAVWPDEIWVAPKRGGLPFGDINEEELLDLAKLLYRLIQIMDLRHGSEFPFNFYIYPGKDWYLRLIPRLKVIGGFDVGTGVFVNTQDPSATNEFIREHFNKPNLEKIKSEHRARYSKHT